MVESLSETERTRLTERLRPRIEAARLRLIGRFQEMDARLTDGSGTFPYSEQQRFHRAVSSLIRRGESWKALEARLWGYRSPGITGFTGTYCYALPLRHSHEDPAKLSPTLLLRRILKDLVDALTEDEHLGSLECFDLAIYQKFLGVQLACQPTDARGMPAGD